uniref:Nucleolar protein 56 n=1 Tax=Alexandrium catenella TaxID=2925 RepID=A0A7S1L7E6_ALECA|mmetsp:Transcript_107571/g.286256  ORF Transcript_107571/g.286256 Transcript_107571/m.286256 type:complete len:509 (+) Transcript_107571:87-1613(+)|eukprot:CAMPEP_0171235574 /NCGR_PEP_ID=MMETSP0790-20130122/42012_1 /TAXON_ID=2925 /ORGANISM="Alexandrium catenella, Strain OF101" /LENGTH=508 /DNA_ID=CAMNT_0011701881 /DNA_START=87 /DNA_END=1613 /DNA_ORIENTATION=+
MSTNLYLLYESAAGYALFLRKEFEETAENESEVQESMQDPKKFAKIVALHAWVPFMNAEEALEQVNSIAAGTATQVLTNFLETNLPKQKKKYQLGVYDPELGKELATEFSVTHGQSVRELLRGCRLHFSRLVKNLNELDLDKARLGLGHSFSRNRMQLDPNRQDKPIINCIALLDNLDKNINTFAMRVREWYAWHFPELTKIVTDNIAYAKVARVVRLRDSFAPTENKDKLVEACGAEDVANEICKAMRMSMGQDIVEMDMTNIDHFALEVIKLSEMRKSLHEYLKAKMDLVAPNLSALIGEIIGARLISHAGSLTNLAKYPASTVQILGAEKALFRALKTKGNTPKYGLIFHSTFIGRAQQKNKGRISRYLANKCSLASRIDNFSDEASTVFGEKLRDQVEERLAFLSEGTTPRKNIEVMQEAIKEVKKRLKKKKKAEAKGAAEAEGEVVEEGVVEKKKKKKQAAEEEEAPAEEPAKKKKKRKEVEEEEAEPAEEAPKKKKKKDSEA